MPSSKRTRLTTGRVNRDHKRQNGESPKPSTDNYFREGVLAVKGYKFDRTVAWGDPGLPMLLAEGTKIDGRNHIPVVAKISEGAEPEKEGYIVNLLSSALEGATRVFRLIELISIPPIDGNVKIVIYRHPGNNSLSSYMSVYERRGSFLPGTVNERENASQSSITVDTAEDSKLPEVPHVIHESHSTEEVMGRSIDLSSFLHFAMQTASCLEVLHANYGAHGDIRTSTFHWSTTDDLIRIARFGGPPIHLDDYGSVAALLLETQELCADDQEAVKDILCYIPPEHSGLAVGGATHLSDLYSLGATFFRLLSGRRLYSGSLKMILSAILTRDPPSLHLIRPDIPIVISKIVQKLLAKNPDDRYASASGLKEDILEASRNLGQTWASDSGTVELIKEFPLGRWDRSSVFHIPGELHGREQEAKLIQRSIRDFAIRYSRRSYVSPTLQIGSGNGSALSTDSLDAPMSSGASTNSTGVSLSVLYPTRMDGAGFKMLIVRGSAGSGKSSLLARECHRDIPETALVGQAKFDPGDPTPYSAILRCMSSVLRQFLTLPTAEWFAFGDSLRERLGPQIGNVSLLFSAVPELERLLKTVWTDAVTISCGNDAPGTAESRVRFENLLTDLVAEITSSKLVTLFLDDLHNADASSLAMLEAFARARVNVLVLSTMRTSYSSIYDRLAQSLGTSHLTTVNLRPLTSIAISGIVCSALHVDAIAAAPLVNALAHHSHGNPFTIRSLLSLLHSENYLVFDFNNNQWTFSPPAVEQFLGLRAKINPDNVDANFLVQHLREMATGTQEVLAVAAAIGPTFNAQMVFSFIEDSEALDGFTSSDDLSDTRHESGKKVVHSWVSGLQSATTEGMVIAKGKDMYAFTHDRYREAALLIAQSHFGGLSKIAARLVDLMLDEGIKYDHYKISDQILRCLPILRERPQRDHYTKILMSAGAQAFAQGAPESSFIYYESVYELNGAQTEVAAVLKLCELLTWKGDIEASENLLNTLHNLTQEQKMYLLQTRSRNLFSKQDLAAGQELLFAGLRELGVDIRSSYTGAEVEACHDITRSKILNFGIENIRALPPASDLISNLRNTLLAEVWIHAYFRDQLAARMITYQGITLALENGLSAHNGLALLLFASAAVTRGEYKLAIEMGRLSLEVAQRLSTTLDRGRAHLYYVSLVAPSDSEHFMQTWALAVQGYKLARTAGDALFAAFGQTHLLSSKFYTMRTLGEVVEYGNVALADLASWPVEAVPVFFTMSIHLAAKAIAGLTHLDSAEEIFDTDDRIESEYVALARKDKEAAAWDSVFNWHEAYRLAALYNLGYPQECFEAGKYVISTAEHHPGHRHIQLALFYSGIAACQLARDVNAKDEYLRFAKSNLARLEALLIPATINIAHWYYLLAAEIGSLEPNVNVVMIYDKAIDAAERGQWVLEEAWATYLAGLHFERCGASTMARSFQKQALARFTAIGAHGVIKRLMGGAEDCTQPILLAVPSDYMDAEIQTDTSMIDLDAAEQLQSNHLDQGNNVTPGIEDVDFHTTEDSLERVIKHLSSKDLAVLIHALQTITTDVNLSSSLERLTNLMTGTICLASQYACIVVRNGDTGDFHVYTTQRRGEQAKIFSPTLALHHEEQLLYDGVLVPVIHHVLHSGRPLLLSRVADDPRFRFQQQDDGSSDGISSVLVLPVRSKGVTQGALYLGSSRENAFSEGDMLVLGLLAMQAAVMVSNGFLFASLRRTTQANLRAISDQRIALEAARKSQEEALHATRVKSIFLANMSHEMRTPFAAFYGVLGLLSETDLTSEQRELVGTAKQSCELLLETISALLDFSKLEAHAVKLSIAPLSLNDLLVDCQELLITLAADKALDLTYSVEPDVPIVDGDGARLRQILQNLIGNALKFTLTGGVDASISIDRSNQISVESSDVCVIKLQISDTGIGLSKADIARLFLPFSQVDSSSTRSFGGTGLGLSICRELLNLMGGQISVSSQIGTGSCFTALIPLRICSVVPPALSATIEEVESIRRTLRSSPKPMIVAISQSSSTRALLSNYLHGLNLNLLDNAGNLVKAMTLLLGDVSTPKTPKKDIPSLQEHTMVSPILVIIDGSTDVFNEVATALDNLDSSRRMHMIQILPRSATTMHRSSSAPTGTSDLPSSRVIRCSKPIRELSLLRAVAEACNPRSDLHLELPVPQDTLPSPGSSRTPKPKSSALPSPVFAPPKVSSFFTDHQLESFKKTHILIAEDNLVAQRLLSRQLTNLGFVVTASSNGLEAVEKWSAQVVGHFKVALFDHHMPLSDGLSATRRIRELEKEKGVEDPIPIISLTADAHTQAMEDCLNAGMQMYLTKPLRQDDLLRLIRTYILQEETPTA